MQITSPRTRAPRKFTAFAECRFALMNPQTVDPKSGHRPQFLHSRAAVRKAGDNGSSSHYHPIVRARDFLTRQFAADQFAADGNGSVRRIKARLGTAEPRVQGGYRPGCHQHRTPAQISAKRCSASRNAGDLLRRPSAVSRVTPSAITLLLLVIAQDIVHVDGA